MASPSKSEKNVSRSSLFFIAIDTTRALFDITITISPEIVNHIRKKPTNYLKKEIPPANFAITTDKIAKTIAPPFIAAMRTPLRPPQKKLQLTLLAPSPFSPPLHSLPSPFSPSPNIVLLSAGIIFAGYRGAILRFSRGGARECTYVLDRATTTVKAQKRPRDPAKKDWSVFRAPTNH